MWMSNAEAHFFILLGLLLGGGSNLAKLKHLPGYYFNNDEHKLSFERNLHSALEPSIRFDRQGFRLPNVIHILVLYPVVNISFKIQKC